MTTGNASGAGAPGRNGKLDEGLRLHRSGNLGAAEKIYREVLAANPRDVGATYLLAELAMDANRPDVALHLFQNAARLRPEGMCFAGVAKALMTMGRLEEAQQAARLAVAKAPNDATVRYAAGVVHFVAGDYAASIENAEASVRIDPKFTDGLALMAHQMIRVRRIDEAYDYSKRVLAIDPNHVEGHWTMAIACQLLGRFEEGWPHFKHYPKRPAFGHLLRGFKAPWWDGEDLNGKAVLLHSSGGFGDAIQYVRYVPLVAQRWPGAKVYLECPKPLRRLFETVSDSPNVTVVTRDEAPLPAFDYHATLQLLPAVFNTPFDAVPAEVPYFQVEQQKVAAWRERLGRLPGLKVGLVWAGSVVRSELRTRSLDTFAPLAGVDGVTYVSLQKGEDAKQPRPAGLELVDWTEELGDFLDTANLIAALDLVVTIDTSVAHLSGALGQRTLTLIPQLPDFRWTYAHPQTPWYPTMKLFRQPTDGPWSEPVGRIVDELKALVATGRA